MRNEFENTRKKYSIKVAKSLCKEEDGNQFHSAQLIVQMPKTSQYSDYHFKVYYYYEIGNTYCELLEPKDTTAFTYELIKTEREEGKRYRRPRLYWKDLKQEFEQHQQLFDKSALPKALAFVYDYQYKGSLELMKNGRFVVGAVDDKWFWVGVDDRRRISAKNFKLISNLAAGEDEAVQKDINELNKSERELSRLISFNGIREKARYCCKYELGQFAELQPMGEQLMNKIDEMIDVRKKTVEEITCRLKNYHSANETDKQIIKAVAEQNIKLTKSSQGIKERNCESSNYAVK